jgi:putative transcriptional regulator
VTIRHHPDDVTLMFYASGTLPVAIACLVASHAWMCPHCRARVGRLKLVGALLMQAMEPQPASVADESAAMRRFADEMSAPPVEPSSAPSDPLLPAPLADYLQMAGDDIRWKTLVKGLQQYRVKLPKGAGEIQLLKARPGLRLPKHRHRGMELTIVLKGAYRDATGEYHRGDVADLDEDIEHQPKVMDGEECICIIASEKPARYTDLLPRLLQPIMGF